MRTNQVHLRLQGRENIKEGIVDNKPDRLSE